MPYLSGAGKVGSTSEGGSSPKSKSCGLFGSWRVREAELGLGLKGSRNARVVRWRKQPSVEAMVISCVGLQNSGLCCEITMTGSKKWQ